MALIDDFLPALAFAAMLGSEPNLAQTPYATARADMDRLLRQAVQAARRKNPSQADQAMFAVCAFADEIISASSWPGRTQWMGEKLQQVHFNTVNAGEEFYQRLSALTGKPEREQLDMSVFENLENRHDQDQREVLEVYVTCLTLGFRGRYYGDDGKTALEELTRANLARLRDDQGHQAGHVFPEAYQPAARKGPSTWFSPGVRLITLFVLPALLAVGVYATYASMLTSFVSNWMRALG